ncbi:vWA domain-containing protein [Rhodococcus artemisiae]|uniref:VWA domain-containing protein n=1 Tax=Rhodococcus artemisiae TaxID=714159 RepID=A0ABU7L524_9NOCA|nr:VWA domain-containing protein [Rhodococcus artemisiae]MEE2056645.1 VWA domain-containing protein [Rhodococcus artemisiae]
MTALLLPGIDRAAFAVALADRLRRSGIAVTLDGAATLTRALRIRPPRTRSQLYWAARLTLVDRRDNLEKFDAVFSAVFDHGAVPMDPHARRAGLDDGGQDRPSTDASNVGRRRPEAGGDVPWVTRSVTGALGDRAPEDNSRRGERLPSVFEAVADQRFSDLDPARLAEIASWLEHAAVTWPTRVSRRRESHHSGRLDLRASIAASRHTGYEPVRLVHTRPARRRRQLVLFCDVSRSMRAYADIYLHLMRAVVRAGDAEVFAFSTTATRLTPTLKNRSVEQVIDAVNDHVETRFGGTRIAGSLSCVLRSHRGHALRGAIVVIASDGWDSDDPEDLARVMTQIRRRAHRVVWLNPRAGLRDFAPATGSMAAALQHCDALLPADTLTALRGAIDVVAGAQLESRRTSPFERVAGSNARSHLHA